MSFKYWLSAVVALTTAESARGFDPFTIAAGAQAASGILGGSQDLESGADTALALGDLLVELEIDPTADKEAQAAVRKLEDINRMVSDAKYTKRELEDVLKMDDLHSKSHAQKIRHILRLVRTFKRIGTLLGLRPKTAERVNQIQQTQISYMMLEELTALRQAEFRRTLDSRASEVQRKVLLEKIREEEERNRSAISAGFRNGRRKM